MPTQRVSPLTFTIPIVDAQGRPTPEFQRKWSQQAAVNQSGATQSYVDAGDAATLKAAEKYTDAHGGGSFLPLTGGTMTGAILAADGAAATPSVVWGTNTGFFNDVTNTCLGLSIGGTQHYQFDDVQCIFDYAGGTGTVRVQAEGSTAINLRRATTDANGAVVAFQKQRGTLASPSVPAKNDALGSFNFQGYNGSGYTTGATCSGFLIEPGTVGSGAMGSEIRFLIAAAGAGTLSNTLSFNPQDGIKWGGAAVGNTVIDANRLLLLRNFTTGSLPASPATGALAYDITTATPKFYTGAAWTNIGGVTGANPTATASDTAVNGSAITFMRSDAAPAVQKTSASQFGLCKPDNSTIVSAGGVLSAGGVSVLGFSPFFTSSSFTKPVAANFTLNKSTNAGTSTLADLPSGRGMVLAVNEGTNATATAEQAALSSSAFTLTAFCYLTGIQESPTAQAIYIKDNTGKYVAYGTRNPGGGNTQFEKYTYSSLSGTILTTSLGGAFAPNSPLWLRVQLTGGNFIFSSSFDGENYQIILSEAASVIGGTISTVGIGAIHNGSTATRFLFFDLFSWTNTSP